MRDPFQRDSVFRAGAGAVYIYIYIPDGFGMATGLHGGFSFMRSRVRILTCEELCGN